MYVTIDGTGFMVEFDISFEQDQHQGNKYKIYTCWDFNTKF